MSARSASAADPRVFGLDFLRAAAILSVVVAHAAAVLYPHLPPVFGLIGHGGFYGVELFFVLSGFLIGQILLREDLNFARTPILWRFYLRRWFRTLPLFWLFLFVNVALESRLRRHQLGILEVVTHGLFLRSLTSNHLTFFAESWSLAIEEWFYLLFPAALCFALRFFRRFDPTFLSVAAMFYVGSTALRVLGASSSQATWAEWQREIVIYRFDALMIGIVAAWLACRLPAFWRSARVPGAFLSVILLSTMYATLWRWDGTHFVSGPDDFFARTFRFNLVSLGFALLLPLTSAWRLQRENATSICVRKIALWSYALYLVHLPLFALVAFDQNSATRAGILFLAEIGLAIALSAALFSFFESPMTRLRERFAPAPSRNSR